MADPAAAVAPESPAGFKLRTEPPSVMRLSPKSLGVLGGAASLAIGGALLYALQPAGPKVAENLLDSDSPSKSERVTGAPADYGKISGKGDSLPGDLGHPLSPGPANGETVTALPIGPSAPPHPRDAAAEQAHLRLLEEGNAARASQVFLDGIARAPSPSLRNEEATPIAVSAAPAGSGATDKRHDFLSRARERPPESAARLSAPSSSHVVQAGSVIPAALITGIRSDLPGQITAQVTQNVYDSATGRNLLIPQGARLIGEYDSEIAAGQSRVLLAWDRLILPGGRSIALDRLPGADAAGMAGLADRTDYHWGHMLKAALISTLLGVSAELGASDEDRLVRAARGGAQDSINETGRQVVERQLRVPPTITIRPGFTLRVIVTRDLMLEPVDGGVQ